jgi:hypothetical protein
MISVLSDVYMSEISTIKSRVIRFPDTAELVVRFGEKLVDAKCISRRAFPDI